MTDHQSTASADDEVGQQPGQTSASRHRCCTVAPVGAWSHPGGARRLTEEDEQEVVPDREGAVEEGDAKGASEQRVARLGQLQGLEHAWQEGAMAQVERLEVAGATRGFIAGERPNGRCETAAEDEEREAALR